MMKKEVVFGAALLFVAMALSAGEIAPAAEKKAAAPAEAAVQWKTGTVTAGLLNARLKPDLNSVVAGKLHAGEKVVIIAEKDGFAELYAPKLNIPVYISAVYVQNNKTFAPVTMRTAMHSEGASYGILPKGSPVVIKSQSVNGWAKIVPPEMVRVYAAIKYIKVDGTVAAPAKPAEKTEQTAAPAKEAEKPAAPAKTEKPAEKKTVTPAEKPAEKKAAAPVAEKKAAPTPAPAKRPALSEKCGKALKGMGCDVTKFTPAKQNGIVVELTKNANPALTHALVRKNKKDSYDTVCYLFSDGKIDLAKLANNEVSLSGESFTVPSWKTPVIRVLQASVKE